VGRVLVLDDAGLHQGLNTLRWHLGRLLAEAGGDLVIDVGGLSHLSSATVAVLLRTRRLCRARGQRLVLVRPNGDVGSVLRRSGLENLFEVSTRSRAS
jgi:anti-anti-sigma factor